MSAGRVPDEEHDDRSVSCPPARPPRRPSQTTATMLPATLVVPPEAKEGDMLTFMTQVGLFSLLFTADATAAMTPDRNLSVSVPVAPETLAAHRTREKEFEKFRSFAHCKWICVERDGQYLTPPKRPTTSTDQTPPDADMPNPSKELPRAELRLASPVAIRSLSNGAQRPPSKPRTPFLDEDSD